MTKRIFTAALFAVFILSFAPMAAHAQAAATAKPLTIGIVDVEKILAQSKAAQGLQTQIKSKRESFQKEFSAKEKQLKQTETTLITGKDKMSVEEFAKKRKEYEDKVLETSKLYKKSRSSLEQGMSKAMSDLRKNIFEAAAQAADERKFDIVVTRESVLVAEKSLDITDAVLTKLNAKVTSIPLSVQ